MKIACTGLEPGRLSSALMEQGVEFIKANVLHKNIFRYQIEKINPDVIIHTAAATGVDWCEDHPQEAVAINARGVDNIVSWWKGRLIYISTDYVFDGQKWLTRGYTEKHNPKPISRYGMSKLGGEIIAANGWSDTTIVRTTVLYGGKKPDFVTWVLSQFVKGEPFSVSTKMVTTPTNVHHLAEALIHVAKHEIDVPILNIVGSDLISRHGFAHMIGTYFDRDLNLLKEDKEPSFGKAPRPTRGGLRTDLAKSLGVPIYSVREGLEKMKNEN